ncbi:MAG: alanyl-tRNA editing protein [Clostridia bacterium]|jgi:alanyl-tRNA synthetase|nr:alanyl-tRNA editing protein [Clostridia bacterium]
MLYKENTYVKSFETEVVEVRDKDGKVEVILRETYFYPEGGGQPSDKGNIGSAKVEYVYEKEGKIYHVVDKEITGVVKCEIDWKRRFDFMQQHSGQHIFSRVFEIKYDADTVGFNLTEEKMTIDINKKLSKEEILEVEKMANEIIYSNVKFKNYYTDKEGCKAFDLRKQPEIEGEIRLVEIENFDWCPCCGTHVNSTGEVGVIKVNKIEGYKEGHRIEFSCGFRVVKEYNDKNNILTGITSMYSASTDLIVDILKKQKDENVMLSKEVKALSNKLVDYKVSELLETGKKDFDIKIDMDFNNSRMLATKIVQNEGYLVKFESDEAIIYAKSKNREENIKEEFNNIIKEKGYKGGGNEYFLQAKK